MLVLFVVEEDGLKTTDIKVHNGYKGQSEIIIIIIIIIIISVNKK
jgi:hypothetical protein